MKKLKPLSQVKPFFLTTIILLSPISTSVFADIMPRWYKPENITNGKKVYNQHCVVCHKADLSGTREWSKKDASGRYPPPPLNGSAHTWHHSLKVLAKAIKYGGVPNGGWMPGFEKKLSKEEIKDVIAWIQSNWSEETYQTWFNLSYGNKKNN